MKRLQILSLLIFVPLLLIVSTLPLYGQGKSGNASGKSNAPGQTKKEDNVVVGSVDTVSGNTIVVDDKKNNKKTEAVVDSNTKVVGQDKKTLRINQIKPKDLVAVLSTDSGEPATEGGKKKVVKVFVKDASASAQSKRRAIQGLITAINDGLITVVHQIHQDRIFNLLTNALTLVKMKGVIDATVASLDLGMRIAAVGDLNEEGILVAKRIHVIPGKGKGLPGFNPTATPSATPSATPTATPSATPTATASATPTP